MIKIKFRERNGQFDVWNKMWLTANLLQFINPNAANRYMYKGRKGTFKVAHCIEDVFISHKVIVK